MPRRADYDRDAVDELIATNERVVTHSQLMGLGVSRATICRRMQQRGPWQWILPGVTLCHTGTPTRRERLLAAIRYGGEGTVITGASGLREHGVREPLDPRIHVLVPHDRHRSSHHFVIIERTRYLPRPNVKDGLALAPVERCCLDACRRDVRLARVRAAIAEVVQRRKCAPETIRMALETMATQRSALPRAVMREIDLGVRSAAEGDANAVFRVSSVPAPEWNVSLFTPDGTFLCTPDGWWDDLCIALQIDSMQWHLSPEMYKRTQANQRLLAQLGIPVLPWAPGDVSRDPDRFLASVRAFRAGNAGRPRPEIVVVRNSQRAA